MEMPMERETTLHHLGELTGWKKGTSEGVITYNTSDSTKKNMLFN